MATIYTRPSREHKLVEDADVKMDTISKLSRNSIKWFTDGSKMAEEAGIRIYGLKIKYFKSLEKYLSIFYMEIHTIAPSIYTNTWFPP